MGGGERKEGNVLKGLAAGIVAGLAAAWTMNQFQAAWSRLTEGEERSHGAQSLQQGSPQHGIGRELQSRGKDEEQDDAPERLANAIEVAALDHELTEREKEAAGTAFHYAMGATSGALYGAVAEIIPGGESRRGPAVWRGRLGHCRRRCRAGAGAFEVPDRVSDLDPRLCVHVAPGLRLDGGGRTARGTQRHVTGGNHIWDCRF